ncbi:MAG: hypothetical protein ACI9FB_002225 [Candidatus Azotimanducaceae bacterium]|jgi:hypothetical protein
MNMFERQVKLDQSLCEINSNVVQEFNSLQQTNIKNYGETSRKFGSHIREVNDISSVVELQRDDNETPWNNTKFTFKAQKNLISSALSNTRVARKFAYSPAEKKVIEASKPKVMSRLNQERNKNLK